MKWLMQFYHERRGLLAPYSVDALLPAEAILLGWKALLAEYPPIPGSRRPELVRASPARSVVSTPAGGSSTGSLGPATLEDSSPESPAPAPVA